MYVWTVRGNFDQNFKQPVTVTWGFYEFGYEH